MDIGLVNDWLTTFAGSEKVLSSIAELYPNAPIYTLLHDTKATHNTPLGKKNITTSVLQKMPFAVKQYKATLPLMPFAIEQLDLNEHQLIISSSHAVAKGVITNANQLHICYMHTPIRYAWDLQHSYLKQSKLGFTPKGLLVRAILHYLRNWDQATSNRVDIYVANSKYVARRIQKTYRREAEVVYPPVDVERFDAFEEREDFYLTVSRLVPYKFIDEIVRACKKAKRRLVVIGDGPEMKKLKLLRNYDIELLGQQDDETVTQYMQKCKALIFAADEDFGIVPVEAQAAGAPVIAFGRGGCTETVIQDQTGIFFTKQDSDAILDAIQRFEQSEHQFNAREIATHAEQFSKANFMRDFENLVERHWDMFQRRNRSQFLLNTN